MKKTTTLIVLLTSILLSCAQTQTFDIATFKAPKGWEKSTKEGLVSYSTSNVSTGTFCIISIYASSASNGTAEQEFNQEWNDLAATPFGLTDAPEIETTTDDDGREVVIGSSTFQNDDIAGAIIMYTFVGFGRTNSVLFFTNAESHQKDIEDFLLSLTLKKTTPKAATTAATTTKTNTSNTSGTQTNTSTTASTPKPSNNLEGMWMGVHSTQYYGDQISSGTLRYLAFFKNGRIDNGFPDDPDTYNYNASKLGSYQINNGNASLKWFSDGPWINIVFKNSNQIEVSSIPYYRCKVVDGLKLQGTWTSLANPNDASLDDGNGAKSMISFSKNGSFTDYGIFKCVLDQAVFDRPPTPPGSGTYSINNFCLTLNYSNGTTRKIACSGFLGTDVFSNDKTICLQNLRFSKRN